MFSRGLITGVLGSAVVYSIFDRVFYNSKQFEFFKIPEDSSVLEDANKLEQARSILKYGSPNEGPYLRFYSNHVLSYDQSKRTPVWVAECITQKNINGPATRKNIKFRPDPSVPALFTAHNTDYSGSGWSRGHMAPAGDNRMSEDSMAETFYLSNIVPQNLQNNAGFWNRLEMYCRDLTKTYTSVFVITGPLILPQNRNGKQFVEYEVIGKSQIAVPTHLFKVILAENDDTMLKPLGAFIVPNKPIGFDHQLTEFKVGLEEIERITGVTFLPKLDRKQTVDLCMVESCKLIGKEKFLLFFISKKLKSARNTKYLDKVWKELEENNLKPDEHLSNLYNSRKEELLKTEKEKANMKI